MGRSLVLLLPSFFWIKRLVLVIPIGIVLEQVRATDCSFAVHSILFSFPCFVFPGALFDSFICFSLQYNKMMGGGAGAGGEIQDNDKQERNANPVGTRD